MSDAKPRRRGHPAARQTCPRRLRDPGPWQRAPDLDTWAGGGGLVGAQENELSCSFCGSLHPDVFLRWTRDGGELCPTDKPYKIYIDRPYPDERYGGESRTTYTPPGGSPIPVLTVYGRTAKFYFQHLGADGQREFVDLYNAGALAFKGGQGFYRWPFFMRPGHPPAETDTDQTAQ